MFAPTLGLAQEAEAANAKIAHTIQAATVSRPNGATYFGDCNTSCAIADNRKTCALNQQQGNGQRVFVVELQLATAAGDTPGVMLLRFGIKLGDGVKLKFDEQALGQGARFSTCVPAGCLVPMAFLRAATDAMKKGEKFIVTATLEGGEPPVFTASLIGFTAAMNRVAELGM